ncbi:glycosyltransferase family 2 protein [Geosporobacter ferrireducens]|uniref:glycosyltransferase family 2 protein n=1 Tax=Geosporobacter ferrireducens TaxID=1424294 RepID=UPI00139DD05A|nr:glycosyltransferase family 2 protein [Geosporobacter ferrireducens]MTI53323.1 glycosyltransferase family 2 protein [Geosporobacter ferrireducens]
MKLVIQIPCYNEEESLPITLKVLPKEIDGIDEIEVLIVDDGSVDRTIEVAKEYGIKHFVRFTKNKGLAKGFMAGVDAALKLGADIIVNTDADNQYCAEDIERLVRPILDKECDVVIGDRQTDGIEHFSFIKKKLQKLGSWVVRKISSTDVIDTTSGFRAYSRDAAMRLNVVSEFTYTLETIIQSGYSNISIKSVPVRTNNKLRESRLFKGIWNYVYKSVITMIRIFSFYKPLRFFVALGSIFIIIGIGIGIRFLTLVYILKQTVGRTYLPSLILGTSLIIIGALVYVIGFLGDIIAANRKLNEEILYRIRKLEFKENTDEKQHV